MPWQHQSLPGKPEIPETPECGGGRTSVKAMGAMSPTSGATFLNSQAWAHLHNSVPWLMGKESMMRSKWLSNGHLGTISPHCPPERGFSPDPPQPRVTRQVGTAAGQVPCALSNVSEGSPDIPVLPLPLTGCVVFARLSDL